MYTKEKRLRLALFVCLCLSIFSLGIEHQNVSAAEIPIEGAVYHVHWPSGSHKTYLDIVVDPSFPGDLPN